MKKTLQSHLPKRGAPVKNRSQKQRIGSVQHTFCPIEHIEHEAMCLRGEIGREWVAILEVQGMNYRLRDEEEQYRINEQFQQILVSLTHPSQILLRIVPMDVERYLSFFTSDTSPDTGRHPRWPGIWRELASSHTHFMRAMVTHRTLLEHHFYVIVPALSESVQEEDGQTFTSLFRGRKARAQQREAEEARAWHQLAVRCQELERKLGAMSLSTHRLSNDELTSLIYTCLRPQEARTSPLLVSWMEGVDRLVTFNGVGREKTTRPNAQTPDEMAEQGDEMAALRWPMVADLIAPAGIQVWPDHVKIEQDHVQVLDIHTLPRRVGPGWFHQLMHIDEVMDISFFYIPQPPATTMRALRRKRFEMHSSTMIDTELDRYPDPKRVAAEADIENLMDRIAAGHDRVLEFAMHVLVRAESAEVMQKRTKRIRAMLYSMQLGSRVAYFEQEKGVRSCLPYARSVLRTNAYPLILGSHEASSTFPFLSQTLFEVGGILEGVTRTGEPIVIDWWEKRRRNANRLIVGPSGSGKTFKAHMDIDRLFLRYAKPIGEEVALPFQCIIVDIEREFRRQTLERGGEWLRLAPGTSVCINPFDLPQTHQFSSSQTHQYVEYRLSDKVADMQALLDVMLAEHDAQGKGRLSNQEKGLLDKALYLAYSHCRITEDPLTHHRTPPLMHDLYDILKSEVCGPDSTGLSDRLHRFVEGSLSGMFSGQTNVALDMPLECFDIHDLPNDLRPIAIFLLSSHVWNRSFGSTIPMTFIVDELASLFQYEEGRRFLETLFQRARKHYLSVVGITQYIGILESSSIPTNCATTIIMAQESASLDLVQSIFHLSHAEVQELRTFGKGEALLLLGDQHFAVRFEASESEYRIATSDPIDLARMVQDREAAEERPTTRSFPPKAITPLTRVLPSENGYGKEEYLYEQ